MAYKIRGWNSFYEGWLARCLEQPKDKGQGNAWETGWDMGDETDETGRLLALSEEIRIGQAGIAKLHANIVVKKI